MFRLTRPRLRVCFAAVEPGAPAAPAEPGGYTPAAPNPGAGHPAGFEDATAAAAARIEEALPRGPQPGSPEGTPPAGAPPAEPAALDIWADEFDDQVIPDNMPYRDAVGLRNEIKGAREQFRPFRDAFSGLDDAGRQTVLRSAPELGADLPFVASAMAGLHPDDRAYMTRAIELMGNPSTMAQGAQMLSDAAETLRGAGVGTAPAPGAPPVYAPPGVQAPGAPVDPRAYAPPPAEMDPTQQPVTRADLDRWAQERDQTAQVQSAEARILARARELGYDPDSEDPLVHNRFVSFIGLAGQPDIAGDLDKAHALMAQADQAVIDRFVEAKAADADRPGVPVTGTTPAQPRVLETNADGKSAMTDRLDATLGPDPRRRDPED